MSKVSPIMKHAKPKLTSEQVAIEDFINSIPPVVVNEGDPSLFANNSITEVVDVPETSLDPIVDSTAAANSLDQLASDVDGVTTAVAMESYKRIFNQLTEFTGHPVASLENFPATKGGVRKFAKSIRSHADLIRGCVSIALEEFGAGVEESIGTSMSNYKQALAKLNEVREDDFAAESEITINYKAFWKLFHMNDELMSAKDFGLEVEGVKRLAALVSQGKANIQKWAKGEDSIGPAIDGKTFVQLMNNTDVTVKDGRSKWESTDVPPPKNNEGKWTAGDWFWILIFSWAGLVYRLIKGGSGTDQAKKEQSLKAIHQVIGEMKRLAPIVQGIEKDAKEIVAACNQAKEDRQGDLKRAASPVLELAAKTISHVTSVTYGSMKLFDQAESSADKQERDESKANR